MTTIKNMTVATTHLNRAIAAFTIDPSKLDDLKSALTSVKQEANRCLRELGGKPAGKGN